MLYLFRKVWRPEGELYNPVRFVALTGKIGYKGQRLWVKVKKVGPFWVSYGEKFWFWESDFEALRR